MIETPVVIVVAVILTVLCMTIGYCMGKYS